MEAVSGWTLVASALKDIAKAINKHTDTVKQIHDEELTYLRTEAPNPADSIQKKEEGE